jgi:hypothetical protein
MKTIETSIGRTCEESDSVKDFFSVAYPGAEPTEFALTGIQRKTSTLLILKKIIFVIFVGILFMQISSCDKDNNTEKVQLSILMTDVPANYDAVTVDVQSVEITGNGGNTVMLNTNAGLYNLLELSNGLNTLIATGDLNEGSVSQIRLILGTNNSVKVDDIDYELITPSAMKSGLKLQINQTFKAGVAYSILLDFDANQSIIQKGNNVYQLKNVIRTIDTAISGSIKGSISPISKNVLITATSNGITYTSVTNVNGNFLIAGLPLGTFDITITPELPLLPIILTGKTVAIGISTDLGITKLL